MSVGVLLLAGILKSQTQIIKDTYLKFVNNKDITVEIMTESREMYKKFNSNRRRKYGN